MPQKVKVRLPLLRAIEALELAGRKLSNIAYNLCQRPERVYDEQEVQSMDESRREWDAAQAALAKLLR